MEGCFTVYVKDLLFYLVRRKRSFCGVIPSPARMGYRRARRWSGVAEALAEVQRNRSGGLRNAQRHPTRFDTAPSDRRVLLSKQIF
jgi:hypothetical protein